MKLIYLKSGDMFDMENVTGISSTNKGAILINGRDGKLMCMINCASHDEMEAMKAEIMRVFRLVKKGASGADLKSEMFDMD